MNPFGSQLLRTIIIGAPCTLITAILLTGCAHTSKESAKVVTLPGYAGLPFHDAQYKGGPQEIPGRVQNEYYDTLDVSDEQKAAGVCEGVTYHDTDNKNKGSGGLNKADTYNATFRKFESPDISYTKFKGEKDQIDSTIYNKVMPDMDALYLGWIEPGEWFRYTVDVKVEGDYSLDIMYTSKFGGHISIDSNGVDITGPLALPSVYDEADPLPWRQAHHWNKVTKLGKFHLKKGVQVLTLHFIDQPVFNFDYMEFVLQK